MFQTPRLFLIVMLLPTTLRADSWLPPTPYARVSENAATIVRVEPGSTNPDGSGAKPAHCRFYRYSEDKKTYEFCREHDIDNKTLPSDVVTPDDGSFLVTFDDYMGGESVVVYDFSGRLLKKWALDDILSDAEIQELPSSTSTIHWRGNVGVMRSNQQEVYISPPESPHEFYKNRTFKGFMLDVKALTISEDPRWRRSPENAKKAGALDSDQRTFRIWRLIALIEAMALVAAGAGWALNKKRRTRHRTE
jgi:hypothetical protein